MEDVLKSQMALKIIVFRKKYDLTQVELSKELEITQAHLSQIETDVRMPNQETLNKLEKMGCLSINDITPKQELMMMVNDLSLPDRGLVKDVILRLKRKD